jgi:hypothetical protein
LNRLQKPSPNFAQHEFLDAAEQAFAAICQGDTSAADTYRVHPDIKEQDWTAIREDLSALSSTGNSSELAQGLRGRLASMVESLVTDHFYASLEAGDRELYAKAIGRNREAEDRVHEISTTHDFASASVLEFLVLNGWVGEEISVDELAALQKSFIDHCREHCALQLALARAQAQGQAAPDAESRRGAAIVLQKEAARRLFAGQDESGR